ncbi:MAG TPA: class IV adenylate cyclase [Pyrinomonadaceae bacterium]|nr:class IV adenylate cyclase [Pyrinomonadaceae bacterium]
MPIETEKKYRLSLEQAAEMAARLVAEGGEFLYARHEENLLFRGEILGERDAVLRLRRTETKAFLTYKENAGFEGGIKKRVEFETEIGDAVAAEEIIRRLGLRLSIVYEKRRKAWRFAECEAVVDELPFGYFMEIEGSPKNITAAERLLGIEELPVETDTYPSLTVKHGEKLDGVIAARFEPPNR